jgi:hypothetical protein
MSVKEELGVSTMQQDQQAANILTARLRRRMLVVSLREELGVSTSTTSKFPMNPSKHF